MVAQIGLNFFPNQALYQAKLRPESRETLLRLGRASRTRRLSSRSLSLSDQDDFIKNHAALRIASRPQLEDAVEFTECPVEVWFIG
jgi:hypothetical protein